MPAKARSMRTARTTSKRAEPEGAGRIRLYTIGFTQKSAETFFGMLIDAGVKRVADVRLNNTSQLAGFAKRDDLVYFLRAIAGIEYVHLPQLAPAPALFDAYKKQKGDWEVFRGGFLALMAERKPETAFSPDLFDRACLLCSEAQPGHCHRRLVAEHLSEAWGNVDVRHLG